MRRNLRRRRNPDWSWGALDHIWPRLRELVPESLMPIEGAAEPVRSNPRLRSNPRVQEYGSGHYGVVMPTRDPKWVFKLTKDRSEASFVNAMRNLGLKCSLRGICRYSTVYDTGLARSTSSSSGRIYAFWREAAEVAGDDVWTALYSGPRKTMARQAEQRIMSALDVLRSDLDEEQYLIASELVLRDWSKNGLLADTALDLLDLMRLGIVVTDVHLGNWGICRRRPKLLTLIDPGMIRFLTPMARDAASGIPKL